MQQNNLKLCYYEVDTIKAVKFTTSKMKIIQEAFISHQLGDIQIDNLKKYYCRNETGNSESGQSGENEYRPLNNITSNWWIIQKNPNNVNSSVNREKNRNNKKIQKKFLLWIKIKTRK